MKTRISSALLALVLLATPSLAGAPQRARTLPSAEAARLRSIERSDIGALRAGAVSATSNLSPADRTELRALEARNPELQALRAGDLNLTDHDLMVIGIVLGIVIIILLI